MKRDETTKGRLLRAGERLFAEHGIERVRLREINAMAGQRNSSALHYHFGSRDGLVLAILGAHQREMDKELEPRLDELESRAEPPTIREIVEVAIYPLARQLATQSGRDFLRLLPQVLDLVTVPVRQGRTVPLAKQSARIIALLERCLGDLPVALRRERVMTYVLMITSLFVERAVEVEAGRRHGLTDEQFAAHACDVITGALEAPSTIAVRRRGRAVSASVGTA